MPICGFLRYLFLLLLLLLPTNSISLSGFPKLQQQQNLLSVHRPEPNTELVVDIAGEIYLMQQGRRKPIWSFSSGSPIHSSYQPPHATNAMALEYLDDNSEAEAEADDGYRREKVGLTMEELLTKIPVVTHDGAVTLASKETITYLVDAISGRLIHVYKSGDDDDDIKKKKKKLTSSSLSLFIKRTDSKLEYFDKTTRKLAWNVSVSRFNAELHCDPVFNAGDELGPEILTGVYLPLRCGSQGGTEVRAFIEPQLFIKVDGELFLRSWLPDTA